MAKRKDEEAAGGLPLGPEEREAAGPVSDEQFATAVAEAKGPAVVRQDFGSTEIAPLVERSVVAAAEQAKALVQARFIVALRRPRNYDAVRVKLLEACRRPVFAKMAIYRKPVGGRQSVEGPSIRFADEAVKLLGNVDVTETTVFESEQERHVQVSATDLEANLTKSTTVLVKKLIERRSVRQGQEVVGQRQTSGGNTVYIVVATDDEVIVKQAALVAKARRNLELQLVPQDIIEECMEAIKETRLLKDAADPDAARKSVIDAFAALGVQPEHLEQIVGHPLDQCSPAELDSLRSIYATIRDGQATFQDYVAQAETAGRETGRVRLSDLKPAEARPEDRPPA